MTPPAIESRRTRLRGRLPKGRRRHPVDAATVLTVFVVLLICIPSRLIFKPLGAGGTPANLVGMLALLWWLSSAFVPSMGRATGRQPIRIALWIVASSILVSYGMAMMTRAIVGEEIRSADRGLITLGAWMGIALIAADGIDSRARLDKLLRRLTVVGGILAGLGVLQFFTGYDITPLFQIPGLSINGESSTIEERSAFRRVAGTAIHPIEFGVVLALILPMALHYAYRARRGNRRWWWLIVILMGMAIPMSLSRSAIIGTIAIGLMLLPAWPADRRRRALIALPIFLGVMRALIPGLLGTIKSLFTNLWDDPSTQGRTEDYGAVAHFIAERPWFGRGFSTYLPTIYGRILDNQYLGHLIETGYAGLTALLLMFLIGIFTARGARRRSTDPRYRDLAQCLGASMLAGMVSFVTFDAFSFPMAASLVFFLLGCCGTIWRLEGGPSMLRGPERVARVPVLPGGPAPVVASPNGTTSSGVSLNGATTSHVRPAMAGGDP